MIEEVKAGKERRQKAQEREQEPRPRACQSMHRSVLYKSRLSPSSPAEPSRPASAREQSGPSTSRSTAAGSASRHGMARTRRPRLSTQAPVSSTTSSADGPPGGALFAPGGTRHPRYKPRPLVTPPRCRVHTITAANHTTQQRSPSRSAAGCLPQPPHALQAQPPWRSHCRKRRGTSTTNPGLHTARSAYRLARPALPECWWRRCSGLYFGSGRWQ
jgi:hypothetical protein